MFAGFGLDVQGDQDNNAASTPQALGDGAFWNPGMNFTISSIDWPADAGDATRLYLGYVIQTLETLCITFPGGARDPVNMAKAYMDGTLSSEACQAESITGWKTIDAQEATREFRDPRVLLARLAICLLSIKEDGTSNLGEDLSWFIEVLDLMNADTDKAVEIMVAYFDPHILLPAWSA